MCQRMTFRTHPGDVATSLGVTQNLNVEWGATYNLAPMQPVLAVRQRGAREFFTPTWGLIPSWAKDRKIAAMCRLARTETLAEKKAFSEAYRHRRCIILADGLFEWRGPGRQPYYHSLKTAGPLLLAGVWERWESSVGPVETCALCVTEAETPFGNLGDPTPLVLPRAAVETWLNPQVTEVAELQPLLQPDLALEIAVWPVSKKVNSVRNNDPSVIAAVSEPAPVAGAAEKSNNRVPSVLHHRQPE